MKSLEAILRIGIMAGVGYFAAPKACDILIEGMEANRIKTGTLHTVPTVPVSRLPDPNRAQTFEQSLAAFRDTQDSLERLLAPLQERQEAEGVNMKSPVLFAPKRGVVQDEELKAFVLPLRGAQELSQYSLKRNDLVSWIGHIAVIYPDGSDDVFAIRQIRTSNTFVFHYLEETTSGGRGKTIREIL